MAKLRDWVAIVTLASIWACGGSPEQSTVEQFFRAAQSNDQPTLAAMSAVGPPLEVESWTVVEVSSRSTEAFTLPELRERFEAAEKVRDEGLAQRKTYFEDQEDSLAQIIPKLREDPEYKFRGKLGEIQEEWLTLLDERKAQERVFQELKRELDRETGLAKKSVMRQVDLATFDGGIAVTKMLLNLKPEEGDELPFEVTLRKYELSDPASDRTEPARWVIVGIEGASEEARAAASRADEASQPGAESQVAANEGAGESEQTTRRDTTYKARELRGLARVQILAPETKVQGNEAVTMVRVHNSSKDWIARFTVTEHWYDEAGSVVNSSSRTHNARFMPGEIIELELRTRKSANFYQNQFEFSHANGDVNAAVIGSFPKGT